MSYVLPSKVAVTPLHETEESAAIEIVPVTVIPVVPRAPVTVPVCPFAKASICLATIAS